jgi:hypothetical protein
MSSLSRHIRIPEELRTEILALENVQSICNLESYHRDIPDDTIVARIHVAAEALYRQAYSHCGEVPVRL